MGTVLIFRKIDIKPFFLYNNEPTCNTRDFKMSCLMLWAN